MTPNTGGDFATLGVPPLAVNNVFWLHLSLRFSVPQKTMTAALICGRLCVLSPPPLGDTKNERDHNMSNITLTQDALNQFSGSEQFYRHSINRKVIYTEGVQHIAEHGGAYWLLDEIALIQPYDKAVAGEEFQVWTLKVHPGNTATLTCDDGNDNIVFTKQIEFTDFPLPEIKFYFENSTICLPRER